MLANKIYNTKFFSSIRNETEKVFDVQGSQSVRTNNVKK